MPVIVKKLNNSFIQIKNFDKNLSTKLRENLSFFPQNYRYHPKYKAGIWSGKIFLFDARTGNIPFGLAKQAVKIIRQYTKDVVIDFSIFDKGLDISETQIIEFCKKIKFEHTPYDHQIEATIKCLKSKRLTVESATGSGKSFDLFLVANFLLMEKKTEKILLVVPSIQLVEQMTKDFIDYAKNWCDYSKFVHKIYGGEEKNTNKQIVISTYQSLMNLPKKHFEQYTTVMVDECHIIFSNSEATKAVNKIINNCVNAENKFGFSGSLTDSHSTELQLTGLFGKVERVVNARELIDKDILAGFDVKVIILNHKTDRRIELKNQIDSIPKTKKNYETAKYACEMSYMKDVEEKLNFLINFCSKIKKNTIVLFKTIEYGKKIYNELYKNSDKRVYYIDGTIPVLKREQIRENLERYDNCILVGSVGTISTGINVKNIHNAVLAESIKSEIKIIQTIGRILRKLEGKKSILYDISDDLRLTGWTNYGIRHLKSRLLAYKKENHSVSIVKVKM